MAKRQTHLSRYFDLDSLLTATAASRSILKQGFLQIRQEAGQWVTARATLRCTSLVFHTRVKYTPDQPRPPSPSPAVRRVHVQKIAGEGLGLGVRGGLDEGGPVHISALVPTMPAARCGRLNIGDQILSVDDEDVTRLTHNEAAQLLTNTRLSDHVELTVLTVPEEPEEAQYDLDQLLLGNILDDDSAASTGWDKIASVPLFLCAVEESDDPIRRRHGVFMVRAATDRSWCVVLRPPPQGQEEVSVAWMKAIADQRDALPLPQEFFVRRHPPASTGRVVKMARVAELVDAVWQDWFLVLTDFSLQLHATAPVTDEAINKPTTTYTLGTFVLSLGKRAGLAVAQHVPGSREIDEGTFIIHPAVGRDRFFSAGSLTLATSWAFAVTERALQSGQRFSEWARGEMQGVGGNTPDSGGSHQDRVSLDDTGGHTPTSRSLPPGRATLSSVSQLRSPNQYLDRDPNTSLFSPAHGRSHTGFEFPQARAWAGEGGANMSHDVMGEGLVEDYDFGRASAGGGDDDNDEEDYEHEYPGYLAAPIPRRGSAAEHLY